MKAPVYKYLIRKYVFAENIGEAYKKDFKTPAISITQQDPEPVRTEAIGYLIDEE